MRLTFCLGLLLFAGCASEHHDRFNTDDQAAEDRKFFYGNWWRATPSENDAEDHKFFYGGW